MSEEEILQKIEGLEARIEELLKWKEDRINQQLTYPLDKISTEIIQKDVVVATGSVEIPPPISDFFAMGIGYRVNGVQRVLITSLIGIEFTSDFTTDTLTSANHGLSNGDALVLTSTGILPAGLDTITIYYVVSAGSNTFKLSSTSGGSAVNLTDDGSGVHYFGKL